MNRERLLELADHIDGLPTVDRIGSAECTENESAFCMAYTHDVFDIFVTNGSDKRGHHAVLIGTVRETASGPVFEPAAAE